MARIDVFLTAGERWVGSWLRKILEGRFSAVSKGGSFASGYIEPEAKESRADDEHHETHSECHLLRRCCECTGLAHVQRAPEVSLFYRNLEKIQD